MRKLFLILLGLFYAIGGAWAQSDEPWYVGKPIVDIEFEGVEFVPLGELEDLVAPYLGMPFQDELYWELEERLYATEYFESMIPEAIPANEERTELVIRFGVTERPIVNEVFVEGNSGVRRIDILDSIILRRDSVATRTQLRLDEEAIRNLYLEKGFADISVVGAISEPDASRRVDITFTITEGSQTRVSALIFEGISFASESTLRGQMTTKPQGLFNSGVFQEANLALDRQSIERYYHDRGYIDAQVVDVARSEVLNEQGRKELTLTFYIEEGEQYVFGGIEFDGNELYSDEELGELVSHGIGKTLNRTRLEADFLRIYDLYFNNGYLRNEFNQGERRDESQRSIIFTLAIVERERAHIENIVFEGNVKTKDHVLRREIPIETGDVFSKEKVVEGLQNLYNLQYFSSVQPIPTQGSEDGLVNLTYVVEEKRTTQIEFGGTYAGTQSGGFPIIGNIGWTDSNFRGEGQSINSRISVSPTDQSVSFGFRENWLAGRRWNGSIDLSFNHSTDSGEPQDILGPVFDYSDENRVPDPFDGQWVYADSGEVAAPADITDGNIEDGTIVTDYEYALENGTATSTILSGYTMEYEKYDIAMSLSTGYTFYTRLGRILANGGMRFSFQRVSYDDTQYRPYDETLYENLRVWKPVPRLWTSLGWDTRDFVYNPTTGFYLNQSFSYVGGIFPSTIDYLKSTTKAQGFATLFDVPIGESFDLKGIFAVGTSMNVIFPQFDGEFTPGSETLFTDGMQVARGWDPVTNNELIFDNWIELRMPIAEQYLWLDWFASATAPLANRVDFNDPDNGLASLESYLFSLGANLRFTIPGLPIGLYLAKRFEVVNGAVEWKDGNAWDTLDFGVTFTANPF
jgi:outer membrane protein insertion porin family